MQRYSLGNRILAVNLFALIMLAGGVLYLDSFRGRLLEQRTEQAGDAALLVAEAVAVADRPAQIARIAGRIGATSSARIRLYRADGALTFDSWRLPAGPTFALRDPETEPWRKQAARALDRMIEFVGSEDRLGRYAEPQPDRLDSWPEARAAIQRRDGRAVTLLRRAPDRTVIVSAAAFVPETGGIALVTVDTRDVTRVVREERLTSFLIFLGVLALSLMLSIFLARTIVRPLRRLAIAAQRVRLGRAREVVVPRLPSRRDEIGLLARSLSDMSHALRHRIDSIEAFAADVSHELKNPLASLRSAVDTLEAVKDPALQAQLMTVIRDDVARIDRLITDIADASRLDAELARARFEPVDLGQLAGALIGLVERDGLPRGVEIAFARPEPGTAVVMGAEGRLAQLARNLIDNALSFAPDGGVVTVAVQRAGVDVLLRVEDDGPGIPPESVENIFRRFYSERPAGEDFGKHSGLGLAIAAAVAEAHDGRIEARNRPGGGAAFTVTLPAAG